MWSWRVEDFKLVSWRQGDLRDGGFCEGDSYIVLKVGLYILLKRDGETAPELTPPPVLVQSVAPVPSKPEVLIHNIHFWLGCKTSQDESGVAAYKTVELDECTSPFPSQSGNTLIPRR